MQRERISGIFADPQAFDGKEITVCGWARTTRDMKNFGFIELNDGSTVKSLQIVMEREKLANYDEVAKQNVGAAFIVKGILTLTPEAKQPFELKATDIQVEGVSAPDYPLQKKRHSVEFLRTIQHLRPRTNLFNATFRVRSVAAQAHDPASAPAHEPLQRHVPRPQRRGAGRARVLPAARLCLCQHPDHHRFRRRGRGRDVPRHDAGSRESAPHRGRQGRLFAGFLRQEHEPDRLRPAQRRELRHGLIEPEMAFADLNDDLECMEAMVKYIINTVLERCPNEMQFFNSFVDKGLLDRLHNVVDNEFGRVTYTEAVEKLLASGKKFDYPVKWGIDLQTEHERYLTEEVFGRPVFVTDYPKEIKAFYMRLNDDNKTVAAADCLVPGIGEIIGGSQREERLDVLQRRIEELGMKEEDYWWYLDLRRYGSCRHAGFGLGFERMVMYLTGVSNIRDVELHPRTVGNADF